jgi:RNA polymerase sigma factor (sigma-70 family)
VYDAHADDFESLIGFLSSRERAVLRMIYRYQMTTDEIALELHCSRGNIGNIHRFALLKLSERWQREAKDGNYRAVRSSSP